MRKTKSNGGELPVNTRFQLGSEITPEQQAFLDCYGFLHFEQVVSAAEVEEVLEELDRVEQTWRGEGRKKVNGIPIFFGRDARGETWVQRFAFTSLFSDRISALIHDSRFEPVRRLVGENARIGEHEKDGVVVNRNLNAPGSGYPRLGWHTDGLRDIFYLRRPKQMLNVGLHFDDCTEENGGLRLIPGTHEQSFLSSCFRKVYFLSHAPDPDEIVVETKRGDLTVHDGRLWHRVARSSRHGEASLRRTMYVPYLTDEPAPKNESSPTPLYHRLRPVMRLFR